MCRMSSSGLSGSSIEGGADTTGSSDYVLKIIKQPPLHVFADEWFMTEISLGSVSPRRKGGVGPGRAALAGSEHLQLRAYLHMHEGGLPRDESGREVAELIVDSSTPLTIPLEQSTVSKFSATVRCKIRSLMSSESQITVCINFTPIDRTTGTTIEGIQNVFSTAIHIVSYKLNIEARQWEKVWFKDEGGRDKCMQVQVGLCKRDDSSVYNLRVPLKLVLRYADPQSIQVQKQDILRVLGPPKQFIDPDTSTTTIRFRIEDVSKNHQGQDFQVEVCADTAKFPGVAPVLTPSVSVRSKRSKRQRVPSEAPGDTEQSASGGALHGRPHPRLDVTVQGHPLPPAYRSTSQPSVPTDRTQQRLSGVSDLARLNEAMQGVIRWTDEVVNGLYPLQWQIIGYAPFPDGTVDYSRPYYSMPNPNVCITRILSMYSTSTREDLRVLMNAVENTQRRQETGTTGTEEVSTTPTSGFAAAARQPSVDEARVMQGERTRTYVTQDFTQDQIHHPAQISRPFAQTAGLQVSQYPTEQRMASAVAQQQIGSTLKDSGDENEAIQAEVVYVLAKQYKALRTGDRLGFPAFNAAKDILGFYQESSTKVGVERFIPISKLGEDFGPNERAQARQILSDAIRLKSDTVHSIKDWGSVTNLVDNALVYDWSKSALDPSGTGSPSFP